MLLLLIVRWLIFTERTFTSSCLVFMDSMQHWHFHSVCILHHFWDSERLLQNQFCDPVILTLDLWPLSLEIPGKWWRIVLSCVTVGITESDWHVAEVSGGWIYSTHEAHVWLQPENRSVHTVWPRSWRWTTDQDCSCQLRRRQFHFLFFFITLQRDRSFIQCNLIISHI